MLHFWGSQWAEFVAVLTHRRVGISPTVLEYLQWERCMADRQDAIG